MSAFRLKRSPPLSLSLSSLLSLFRPGSTEDRFPAGCRGGGAARAARGFGLARPRSEVEVGRLPGRPGGPVRPAASSTASSLRTIFAPYDYPTPRPRTDKHSLYTLRTHGTATRVSTRRTACPCGSAAHTSDARAARRCSRGTPHGTPEHDTTRLSVNTKPCTRHYTLAHVSTYI